MTKEINLSEEQVKRMVTAGASLMEKKIKESPIVLLSSDSYGPLMHRTWVFTLDTDLVIGSIERYWNGLKMICSIIKGAPRTYFFTATGERTTSKDLKLIGNKEEY